MICEFFAVANVYELYVLQLRNESDWGVVNRICAAWELDLFKSFVVLEAQLEGWAEQTSAVREVHTLEIVQGFEDVFEV
jgi:hypothetical protein